MPSHAPSRETAQKLTSLGRVLAFLPGLLCDIVWVRMNVVGGAETATLISGVKSVLASRPWATEQGLWLVPWSVLAFQIFYACDRRVGFVMMENARFSLLGSQVLPFIGAYLPLDHQLARRDELKTYLGQVWRHGFFGSIFAACKNFSTTLQCFCVGSVVGRTMAFPIGFAYHLGRKRLVVYLLTTEEQGLDQKLHKAAAQAERVRGRINIRSLRRLQSERTLVRSTTRALKVSAKEGLEEKRVALVKASLESVTLTTRLLGVTFRRPVVVVRRSELVASLEAIAKLRSGALRQGLQVRFIGEEGVDAGGLFRDYMDSVARALAESPLFEAGPDGGLLPARQDDPSGAWRSLLFGTGRLMALAVLTNQPLNVCFSRCIYKVLVGERVGAEDVARIDPTFYTNRVAEVLKPGGVAQLEAVLCDDLTFVGTPLGGDTEDELIEGGRQTRVTEENKERYVSLLVEHYLIGRSRKELAVLVEGFHDLTPKRALQATNLRAIELELIVASLPIIDVGEWQSSSVHESSATDWVYTWFWDVVSNIDAEERAKVLSFACGSGRLPVAGVSALSPPFTLGTSSGMTDEHLPTAHTCVNQLSLPPYSSKEVLETRLLQAINIQDAGFGFA